MRTLRDSRSSSSHGTPAWARCSPRFSPGRTVSPANRASRPSARSSRASEINPSAGPVLDELETSSSGARGQLMCGKRSWGVQGGASSTLVEAPQAPDRQDLRQEAWLRRQQRQPSLRKERYERVPGAVFVEIEHAAEVAARAAPPAEERARRAGHAREERAVPRG